MRALLLCLVAVTGVGCVSFFPPHSLDVGRGAAPLKPGELQAHGGVGGGYAPFAFAVGVGGGGGVEGQVSRDLAIGFDIGAGVQGSPIGVIAPTGTYLTVQYNPLGWDNLALRASGGVGVDYIAAVGANQPAATGGNVAPWAAGTAGLVTSTTLGGIEPYLVLNLGARRFIGGPDNKLIALTLGSGLTETIYAGGATVGARINMSDSFAAYGSANTSILMFLPEVPGTTNADPVLNPTANVQIGISYSFGT